jgi:photosystem II stability/assembly factor-like uncharacterized protein
MKIFNLIFGIIFVLIFETFAVGGWSHCNVPPFNTRVDDIFMINMQNGYAVAGDLIVKTIDGGNNWNTIKVDTSIYCRSVEFINDQKGFVGGFATHFSTNNILRMTVDGGTSWSDLSGLLNPVARLGICGLAIADSSTIYGCGNFFSDSAYIIKSTDGGNSWSFMDMHFYATHLIDLFFLNKDTGFATGSGPLPLQQAIILYTTDGGQNWAYTFQDIVTSSIAGYCWKIQHLNDQNYIASIQGSVPGGGRILRSTDGGMNWNVYYTPVPLSQSQVQGTGFIDSLIGWVGGGIGPTFETTDGGQTWDTIAVCYGLNRIFRLNDSIVFASGIDIWKYSATTTGIHGLASNIPTGAFLKVYPNPASEYLQVDLTINKPTRVLLALLDESGKRISLINNSNKLKGNYHFQVNTDQIADGIYFVVLKTYEEDVVSKVIIKH